MRFLVVWLLAILLAGCGASRPVPPSPPAVELPAILPLPLLVETPQQWSGKDLTLIAPLPEGKHSRILAQATLSADGRSVTVIDDPRRALWLAEPLPADIMAKAGEGPCYLKLRGRLSPPGGYGTDARYVYQFSADTITLLVPEKVTLPNLADNQRAFEGSLLQIEGILLAGTQSSALATEVAAGGIPAPDARQVKLRGPLEPRFLEGLEQSGGVRYGPATIVGWWQNNALTPFLMGRPAAAQMVLPPDANQDLRASKVESNPVYLAASQTRTRGALQHYREVVLPSRPLLAAPPLRHSTIVARGRDTTTARETP